MFGSLILTAGLFAGVDTAADSAKLATFTSYTQAWQTARDENRPMLVVLNPADGKAAAKPVRVGDLRKDAGLTKVLDEYVVAEVDTTTEHGKKVLEVFGSPKLPRVVVIDDHQEKQLFAISGQVSNTKLKGVLEKVKAGVTSTTSLNLDFLPRAKADCPMCRARMGF
jgi:hypothetical protein